ncbi:hypothetical protein I5Q31_05665 [Serratia marcescens]|nr:hypothetical protein [Serratia marcescens]MBH2766655.1 hypothetical protein [Serratia marcescens]MBH2766715.1 hypothetical protein [Serratia marcescens]
MVISLRDVLVCLCLVAACGFHVCVYWLSGGKGISNEVVLMVSLLPYGIFLSLYGASSSPVFVVAAGWCVLFFDVGAWGESVNVPGAGVALTRLSLGFLINVLILFLFFCVGEYAVLPDEKRKKEK